MGSKKMCMLVTAMMLILCTKTVTKAQETPSCAQKLVPCASYLNSTHPPASCCTPLKEAVEQERDCLCNLYNTPGLLQSIGINITQALALPKYCNVSSDLSACTASAPPPTSGSPTGVPGKDSNGAGRIVGTGFSGFLLFWVSMMLN